MRKDVLIVGGGVIGCSLALRLVLAGLKVTVIERGRIGCESSRAAAGMLSPQVDAAKPDPFFDLCMRSRSMYPAFAAHIEELSGIDVEYRDEGTLCVLLQGEDESGLSKWSSWQADARLELESLASDQIRKLEPEVTESAARAVFVPGDHQVENRRLMDALAVALERTGVELIEGATVDSLIVERGRAVGVVSNGRRIDTGAVVIAAGCWSSRLLRPAGIDVELIPARGGVVALRGSGVTLTHTVHGRDCYIVPRADGRVLVGATIEYAGFEKLVAAGGISSLLISAIKLVPALREFELVETWCGLRPDTVDHLPIMGPSGIDNLVLATGHFRNGILLAPLTAEVVGDLIISGTAPPELAPFTAERFSRRSVPAETR